MSQISTQVQELLSRMTLEEKIGQMTQVEKNSLPPGAVRQHFIGSVLSGGGGNPADNTPTGWVDMVSAFQSEALETRLAIPILYGVDAVHGHNNLRGAVIFPHNIGLGAARDEQLAARIGRATAEEMAATGVHWNFAPTLTVPQDIRWGRTYEGFGQDTRLVAQLGSAFIQGLQGSQLDDPLSVLGTAKHYLGDGGTGWGTSRTVFSFPPGFEFATQENKFQFIIDQGDTRLVEADLRRVHLAPYIDAIQAGVQTVMASLSSWNGIKMHAQRYLLTQVLKGELGFHGFIVSDWAGIDPVANNYYHAVVTAINAGVDMCMVPYDYKHFITTLKQGVYNGEIQLARIDDAVSRILSVKFAAGVFEHPSPDPDHLSLIGSDAHRKMAREAVAKSLVLLKNEGRILPLAKSISTIFVGGCAANDIGLQCGGWTIEWLGKSGDITPGTTILAALKSAVSPDTRVIYAPDGGFDMDAPQAAEIGIAVLAETPYAEGFGDRADLTVPEADIQLLNSMRSRCHKLVVVLLSGRPLVLTDQLPMIDALVAAWLPGTEGGGVADVLFGDLPFTGKLSYPWPRSMDQVPMPADAQPLYPYGFGLTS